MTLFRSHFKMLHSAVVGCVGVLILGGGLCLIWAGCGTSSTSFQGPEQASLDTWQAIQKRGYLRVGATYNFPPQGYLDENGQPTGFEIELIRAVAREMMGKSDKGEDAVKLTEVTNVNWHGMLAFGQVDFLLASTSTNAPWSSRYDYSKPYYQSTFRVLVRDKSDIRSLADLKGKKVTFLFGGTSENILKKQAPQGTILVGFRTLKDEIDAFKKGEVDALAQQESVLKNVKKQSCNLRFLPEKLSPQPFAVMFKRDPKNAALKKEVQAALDRLEASGELARLKQKWYTDPPLVKCTAETIF